MVFHAHAGRRERVMGQELGDLAAVLDQFEVVGDRVAVLPVSLVEIRSRHSFITAMACSSPRARACMYSPWLRYAARRWPVPFRAHLADLGLDAALFLLHGLYQVHQFVVVLHGFLPLFHGWCR